MANDKTFNTPDADVIIRATGPPERDFRVHKLILSLASPVFKEMFSHSRPTSPTPEGSNVLDVIPVTDPPRAFRVVLKMIYPFPPPSLEGDLDTLVECLLIAEKYGIQGVTLRLRTGLSRVDAPLRVYAIASRFGFTELAECTLADISLSVNLTGVPQLPDDFDFVSATTYHNVVIRRALYLEAVAEVIKGMSPQLPCYSCRGGAFTLEVFRLRLAHIIMTGTPVEVPACLKAWVKAYGRNSECEEECVAKFIRAAVSRVGKLLANPGEPTPDPKRKSIVKK